jgi:hypothetical protein
MTPPTRERAELVADGGGHQRVQELTRVPSTTRT